MKNESILKDCENVQNICLIPQAKDIFEDSFDLEQCTTKEEYECMRNLLKTNVSLRNEVCPDSCMEINYQTISKSLPHDHPNYAILLMYYASDHHTIKEEYLVFDFNAIIVALGGSLGLFLGFSFFQCGMTIVDNIFKWGKTINDCARAGRVEAPKNNC